MRIQEFMDYWSNIDTSRQDAEIRLIDEFEEQIGYISDAIYQIWELITRHEVCHFKSSIHIAKIKESIANLAPVTPVDIIGGYHIHHSENSWRKDTTGRSLTGQIYIRAIIA